MLLDAAFRPPARRYNGFKRGAYIASLLFASCVAL